MKREIFQYHNGTREVFGDPLVLRDRLATVSMGEFWNLRAKVAKIDAARDDFTVIAEGVKAREYLIHIARETFGMTPFDDQTGAGSTAAECLAVTEAFLDFLDQKKTTPAPPPTTCTPTANTTPAPTPPITPTTSASS